MYQVRRNPDKHFEHWVIMRIVIDHSAIHQRLHLQTTTGNAVVSVATCNKTYKSFFHNTWSSLLRANWILLSKKPGAVTFIFVIAYISLLMRGANLKLGWCMSVLFEAEGVLINLV